MLTSPSVAGSHTTSGTLTLLFSHILQNPDILEKVVTEIDAELLDIVEDVVPVKGLEAKLPYTMACVHENFRIHPVFTMPLPRQVTSQGGHDIDGHHIPTGVRNPFLRPVTSSYVQLRPVTYYGELISRSDNGLCPEPCGASQPVSLGF